MPRRSLGPVVRKIEAARAPARSSPAEWTADGRHTSATCHTTRSAWRKGMASAACGGDIERCAGLQPGSKPRSSHHARRCAPFWPFSRPARSRLWQMTAADERIGHGLAGRPDRRRSAPAPASPERAGPLVENFCSRARIRRTHSSPANVNTTQRPSRDQVPPTFLVQRKFPENCGLADPREATSGHSRQSSSPATSTDFVYSSYAYNHGSKAQSFRQLLEF